MTSEFSIAVHALVFLNHKGCVFSSEELAENICTNSARVRKVMAKLKKADLVQTKEGIDGGYLFSKDSTKVTLSMIADSLSISFVSANWKTGDPDMECLIASGMETVLENIYQDLNILCYKKLKNITIADIDKQIFSPK